MYTKSRPYITNTDVAFVHIGVCEFRKETINWVLSAECCFVEMQTLLPEIQLPTHSHPFSAGLLMVNTV